MACWMPLPNSDSEASRVCEVAHRKGKLSRAKRDEFLDLLAKRYKQPLSGDDKLMLARMSRRQLIRLGKSQLCRSDQAFVQSLIEIKNQLAER
jgi:hypothetical protein